MWFYMEYHWIEDRGGMHGHEHEHGNTTALITNNRFLTPSPMYSELTKPHKRVCRRQFRNQVYVHERLHNVMLEEAHQTPFNVPQYRSLYPHNVHPGSFV